MVHLQKKNTILRIHRFNNQTSSILSINFVGVIDLVQWDKAQSQKTQRSERIKITVSSKMRCQDSSKYPDTYMTSKAVTSLEKSPGIRLERIDPNSGNRILVVTQWK